MIYTPSYFLNKCVIKNKKIQKIIDKTMFPVLLLCLGLGAYDFYSDKKINYQKFQEAYQSVNTNNNQIAEPNELILLGERLGIIDDKKTNA